MSLQFVTVSPTNERFSNERTPSRDETVTAVLPQFFQGNVMNRIFAATRCHGVKEWVGGAERSRKKWSGLLSSEPMARILAPSHFSQQPGISWTSNGGSWRRSRLIIRLITAEEIPVVKGDDCTHGLVVTTGEYYAGSKDLWYILKAWWNKLNCKFANGFG